MTAQTEEELNKAIGTLADVTSDGKVQEAIDYYGKEGDWITPPSTWQDSLDCVTGEIQSWMVTNRIKLARNPNISEIVDRRWLARKHIAKAFCWAACQPGQKGKYGDDKCTPTRIQDAISDADLLKVSCSEAGIDAVVVVDNASGATDCQEWLEDDIQSIFDDYQPCTAWFLDQGNNTKPFFTLWSESPTENDNDFDIRCPSQNDGAYYPQLITVPKEAMTDVGEDLAAWTTLDGEILLVDYNVNNIWRNKWDFSR
jgi:hypothetical protein